MSMLLGSPSGLLRVLVVGPLAYLALLAMLRLSGKRTLGKMNMFDFVGTVFRPRVLEPFPRAHAGEPIHHAAEPIRSRGRFPLGQRHAQRVERLEDDKDSEQR